MSYYLIYPVIYMMSCSFCQDIYPDYKKISFGLTEPIRRSDQDKYRAWFETFEYTNPHEFTFFNREINHIFISKDSSGIHSLLMVLENSDNLLDEITNKYGKPAFYGNVAFEVDDNSMSSGKISWESDNCYLELLVKNSNDAIFVRIIEKNYEKELIKNNFKID